MQFKLFLIAALSASSALAMTADYELDPTNEIEANEPAVVNKRSVFGVAADYELDPSDEIEAKRSVLGVSADYEVDPGDDKIDA
ncbi:hypothetical protein D9758_018523 [Tetrapyrgos nigripes]|uniref:Uncharacterized protein n=1 Tax=Tetrapyrgos nigripes TaxID=182062 RepID=A0A8H5BCE2_9AGAR|nr:hypothetical protein D9758_018523 [Tetrapyrgos nigripes]